MVGIILGGGDSDNTEGKARRQWEGLGTTLAPTGLSKAEFS